MNHDDRYRTDSLLHIIGSVLIGLASRSWMMGIGVFLLAASLRKWRDE